MIENANNSDRMWVSSRQRQGVGEKDFQSTQGHLCIDGLHHDYGHSDMIA